MLSTSKKIKTDSLHYIHNVLKSKPREYTAISIRTVLRAKHMPKPDHEFFFRNCLKKLRDVISSTNISVDNAVMFMSMDLGQFGDIEANSFLSEELMHYIETSIFQIVYNNSLTMEEWEQSFVQATNGITDNGYIAAMQRTILENSKCLVTCVLLCLVADQTFREAYYCHTKKSTRMKIAFMKSAMHHKS